jgi:hypothetical protein
MIGVPKNLLFNFLNINGHDKYWLVQSGFEIWRTREQFLRRRRLLRCRNTNVLQNLSLRSFLPHVHLQVNETEGGDQEVLVDRTNWAQSTAVARCRVAKNSQARISEMAVP